MADLVFEGGLYKFEECTQGKLLPEVQNYPSLKDDFLLNLLIQNKRASWSLFFPKIVCLHCSSCTSLPVSWSIEEICFLPAIDYLKLL
jgi:hypothetical protein